MKSSLFTLLCDCKGQTTVEAVLVALVFLAVVIALGALWRYAGANGLLQLAQGAASHTLSEGVVYALKDLACF